MSQQAKVVVDGIAAKAFNVLLRRFGWETEVGGSESSARTVVPPFLAINEATWQLIADVFGKVPDGAFVTDRKLVVHHAENEIASLPVGHFVVPAAAMGGLGGESFEGSAIQTAPPADDGSEWISSGRRTAWIRAARARSAEAARSVIFEFTPIGWVFWAPTAEDGRGFLQFVLPNGAEDQCSELWRSTRLIRKWIALGDAWLARSIPCAATARSKLIDGAQIYCGSRAMRFDPMAGDGTGTSLRSAILAAAAVRYVGEHPEKWGCVWQHYETRMARAFRDHVRACFRHYAEARLGGEWGAEMGDLQAALARAEELVREDKEPAQYRLENLSLVAV